MSFIVPKKPQILYAPMLSSFGGGSARGFNPGVVDDGGPYFGPEYDGWTGDRIEIDFSNASINDTSTSAWASLDGFLSSELGYFYGAYTSPFSYVYTNAGSSYSGAANFYGSTSKTAIPNAPSGQADRGITVAYTGNKSPLLIGGAGGGSAGIDVFERDNSVIGKFDYLKSGTIDSTDDNTSLNWDGEHLLVFSRETSYLRAYTLPSSKSASFYGLTNTYQWDIPAGTVPNTFGSGYGGAYLGMDSSGYRWIVSQTTDRSAHVWKLDPIEDGTFVCNLVQAVTPTTSNPEFGGYSFAVDFANRTLLQGAHNNSGKWSVWQE